ncbi:hypothetical protein D3C73_1288170 [compost metagenome]
MPDHTAEGGVDHPDVVLDLSQQIECSLLRGQLLFLIAAQVARDGQLHRQRFFAATVGAHRCRALGHGDPSEHQQVSSVERSRKTGIHKCPSGVWIVSEEMLCDVVQGLLEFECVSEFAHQAKPPIC